MTPKTKTTEQNSLTRSHPTFVPDPEATLIQNFNQLAITNGWGKKSQKYKEERKNYLIAMADTHLGSIDRGGSGGGAAGKLAALQGLCEELGISPVPMSITQCNKRLKTVHVCLIDLIDSRRLGTPIHVFNSYRQLQRHIQATNHYFPKKVAKKGVLKVLLKEIIG